MNLPIVYLRGAESDLLEAFNRYENRVEDLGGEFLLRVETGATLIAQFPEFAPVYHQSFRRLLLNRFPYGLF